ncbi:hypothetical protein CJ030_MR6G011341 [Morella rubra]|uniref:B box-type domain-containing protein n=1 Tax=Morella rubra TaxID=262757 RepID=A0A6A1VBF7_9ROSI|nr:hypothetical protein CJ030_MR6G011341 [Morella rubra]
MKKCELCKVPARTYCESDQASLCWDCDAKVHGANFLVARHYRTLLCHACQSQTPWKASASSSSDEEESVTAFSLKRKRENASDLQNPQGDLDHSSFQRENAAASKAQADDGEATSIDYSLRPWKDRRIGPDQSVEIYDGAASSSATVEALTRIRGRDSLG